MPLLIKKMNNDPGFTLYGPAQIVLSNSDFYERNSFCLYQNSIVGKLSIPYMASAFVHIESALAIKLQPGA